ncbi:MAG: hypothetical protein ACREH3_09750, partial [Geminicoccales bacterium]
FSPELDDLEGRILFLDLDLVIVGGIDAFFEFPGDFCIIENWTQPGRGIGNSSVYRYEAGAHHEVFEHFCRHAGEIIATYANSQTYLSRAIGNPSFWPDSWCQSFKHHCLPGRLLRRLRPASLPTDARVIVFHGEPKPPDAARGIWPGRFKALRPAPWILEHWR